MLYVPSLKKNFISVSGMEDKVFFVTFQTRKVIIRLNKYIPDNTVVTGVREGNLCRFQGNLV